MSIINEALKKVQEKAFPESFKGHPKEPPRNFDKCGIKAVLSVRPKRYALPITLVVLIILVGGALSLLRSLLDTRKEKTQVPATAAASLGLPAALTLNGIVYDEKQPYAIVNNKILLKGDSIEGATLVEIGRDKVRFLLNDREIELNAKH